MKAKIITLLLIMLLAVSGCSSSGNNANTPDAKFSQINTMMNKGYVMSQNQKETINQMVADSKKLVSQGKIAEADKILDEALKLLEVIAETDRFNKSE